jgi:integrase
MSLDCGRRTDHQGPARRHRRPTAPEGLHPSGAPRSVPNARSDDLRGRNKLAALQPWAHDKPIGNRWREACKAAGIRYRFSRQLRHTYGTWMIQAGESIRWVSEQMGHRDATITLKHYSKWLPSLNELAGTKAAVMFSTVKLNSVR